MKFLPRNSTQRMLAAAFCVIGFASIAHCCLWDWDTLQMERRRFPGVLETITGKFVRHSPAYYEWRIYDRKQRMRSPADDPQLADDLAVAHSKLGDHAAGIAILEEALAAHPDRYETLANLGTIHMLAGDLKTGKEYVDRAIVINPDAHFGREKYQSLLAEYFLTERKLPHPASEQSFSAHHRMPFGFAKFVLEKRGFELSDAAVKDELMAAQKGVLGMMHFANHDSPLLLEALGDVLLSWREHRDDAMHLAARAYYRISQVSDDNNLKKQFQTVAKNAVFGNWDYIKFRGKWDETKDGPEHDELEKLSADLERELADARAYIAAIETDEKRWIADGIDVDKAFAEKYYDSLESTVEAAKKQLASEWRDVRGHPHQEALQRFLLIVGSSVVALIGLIWGVRYAIRRRRNPLKSAELH